jgi:hypothetical protein
MAHDVSVAQLTAVDPAIERQMRVWQTERAQRGEDPFDWDAFRDLEASVGAPDPGNLAPPEFFWFSPPARSGPILTIDRGSVGEDRRVPTEWLI